MCGPGGLSAAAPGPKMSSVQHEVDDMYFHPIIGADANARAYAVPPKRNSARLKRKFLVAFDGSPDARCALEYAIQQARKSVVQIHVVNVQETSDHETVIDLAHKEAGERILKAATAQLDLDDIRYTTDVAFGAVADSIVRRASMDRCDLIVIGKRDRLALADFFSPSVSSQVVRLSQVPVTVIKQRVVATTHSPRQISAVARRSRIQARIGESWIPINHP